MNSRDMMNFATAAAVLYAVVKVDQFGRGIGHFFDALGQTVGNMWDAATGKRHVLPYNPNGGDTVTPAVDAAKAAADAVAQTPIGQAGITTAQGIADAIASQLNLNKSGA